MKQQNMTEKWLRKQCACPKGIEWFISRAYNSDPLSVLRRLIEEKRYFWASWLITRVMTKKQARHFAMFCVEQVRYILEKGIPSNPTVEPVKACKEHTGRAQIWGTPIYQNKPEWADITTCAHFSASAALGEYLEAKKASLTTTAQFAAQRGMAWALRADKHLSIVRIVEYGMNLVGGKT